MQGSQSFKRIEFGNLAQGTADHVISIDGGRRLFEYLPTDICKKWVEIPGADHDNVLVTNYPIYATSRSGCGGEENPGSDYFIWPSAFATASA